MVENYVILLFGGVLLYFNGNFPGKGGLYNHTPHFFTHQGAARKIHGTLLLNYFLREQFQKNKCFDQFQN